MYDTQPKYVCVFILHTTLAVKGLLYGKAALGVGVGARKAVGWFLDDGGKGQGLV
jgi:hypothetical protein